MGRLVSKPTGVETMADCTKFALRAAHHALACDGASAGSARAAGGTAPDEAVRVGHGVHLRRQARALSAQHRAMHTMESCLCARPAAPARRPGRSCTQGAGEHVFCTQGGSAHPACRHLLDVEVHQLLHAGVVIKRQVLHASIVSQLHRAHSYGTQVRVSPPAGLQRLPASPAGHCQSCRPEQPQVPPGQGLPAHSPTMSLATRPVTGPELLLGAKTPIHRGTPARASPCW